MLMQTEDGEQHQLILVVDDQHNHLKIIEQVLADDGRYAEMVAISTTAEAIDFLRSRGKHAQAKRPDIVLMNMRLADEQAQTILTEIKTDPKLRRIPTIIFTPDASSDDILNSYRRQCNSFVIKPEDLNHLSETLQVIKAFWLNLVTLPAK